MGGKYMAKKNMGIAIAIIGVIIIAFAFFTVSSGGGGIIEPKNKILCNVRVSAGLLGINTAKISSYTCAIAGQCYFGFQTIPYDFYQQQGYIQLISGGSTTVQAYSVNVYPLPGYENTYQISVCSPSNSYIINLLDNNNQVLETKTGSVS